MDADEYIRNLIELMELEYGMPLHEKLAMTAPQCRQWLRQLHGKQLTLRDAQATIRTVATQKSQQDESDLDELLHYV